MLARLGRVQKYIVAKTDGTFHRASRVHDNGIKPWADLGFLIRVGNIFIFLLVLIEGQR